MAAAPLIIAAVGTGLEVYGQVKNASDRASAAEQDAILKNEQADEMLAREAINENVMRRQGASEQLAIGAQFNGTAGGNVGQMVAAQNNMNEAISNSRRDSEFKAKMLRAGASIDTRLASDMVTSSWISGAGSMLSAGASAYSRLGKFGSSSELGRAPTIGGNNTAPTGPTLGADTSYSPGWWSH